jgi:hypothetical protein
VEQKSVLLRKPGRWPEEQTRVARKLSLRLDFLSTVEKASEQQQAKEKSDFSESIIPFLFLLLD